MDAARFEELKAKARSEEGLSEDEANELGRLYAEERGEPYSNAQSTDIPATDRAEGERPDAYQREEGHAPEEERAVGLDRQQMAPTGSGFAPDAEGTTDEEEGLERAP
jgi:hypothetical protein